MLSWGAIAVAASLASLSPVQTPEIAVLPLRADDGLAVHVRADLQRSVVQGLQRRGSAVLTAADVQARHADAVTCDAAPCWARAAAALHVRYLVTASVEVDGRDYRLRLDALDGVSGEAVASRSAECDVCGAQEVGTRLADEAAALRAALAGIPVIVAELSVDSSPRGAAVSIDGERAGRTPARREVSPGRHVVAVSAEGYVGRSRTVVADGGGRTAVTFDLQPQRPPLRPAWGWATLGVGLAAAATGVTLLVLDERPHGPTCEMMDMAGRCPRRWNTLGSGVGVTVASALVLAGAAVLLGLSYRGRARTKGLALTF